MQELSKMQVYGLSGFELDRLDFLAYKTAMSQEALGQESQELTSFCAVMSSFA